jgi:hypothetical protein
MKSLLVEGLLAVTLPTPKVPRDFARVSVLRKLEPPPVDLLIKSALDLARGKLNIMVPSPPSFIICS